MHFLRLDIHRHGRRPKRAIVTAGMTFGIAVLLTAAGCQTGGPRPLAPRMSDGPSAWAAQAEPKADPSWLGTPDDALGTKAEVRTVAFHPSQPEESPPSARPESPGLAFAAADGMLSETARAETFEIIDGGLSQANLEYPIDLLTALRLAGANHLQIALASERIREACARLRQARVMWVPNFNLGIGFNRHDGPIQETVGDVSDISRQSLYFGGGAGLGQSPLTGAASGPARFFVDLSTADVFFEPLAARQDVAATQQALRAAENDHVLQVGLAYQELVRAQLQADIADEAIHNAEELVDLTEKFEQAGEGLAADTQRARAELQQRRQQLAAAQEGVAVHSAELVRLLRLEPSTQLVAVDPQPLPVELVAMEIPIESLVAQGLTRRPELAQHGARVAETMTRIRQEQWRPWLPHLHVGYAGGGFGGGRNNDLQNFGMRGDFDALAIWQVRNFGFGNRALQQERASQNRQAQLQYEWIRDQVIAEVTQAYARARYRKTQIDFGQQQVAAAADALPLNLKGIRDGVIRPIEAQQAIAGLAAARSLYLASVVDFNRAQLELIRALGEPPQNAM